MSEATQGKGPGGKLTRGEFIGAGAAAAAAATVAGVPIATKARAEEGPGADRQQCAPRCPPDQRRWEVPAGILNAFWGDIFPRLVAKHWAGGLVDQGGNQDPAVTLIGMDVPLLRRQLDHVVVPGVSSLEFRRRVDLVRDYFDAASSAGTLIPIRIVGPNGFDFVLSDQGLDVFLPKKPEDVVEMTRYYVFRRTGRPALGVPFYMTGPTASMLLDAPTGPGQVEVAVSAVFQLVADRSGQRCAEELLECLRLRMDEHERLLLTVEEYECILAPFRCWQLSGSVYRGILNELPRVVAQIWFEEMTCSGATPSYRTYASRFGDPGDDGLRGIFEERLETSLPDRGHMRFEAYGQPDPDADVRITNQGVSVPAYPAAGSITSLDQIYAEIARGKAGNPVFTDSKQTT